MMTDSTNYQINVPIVSNDMAFYLITKFPEEVHGYTFILLSRFQTYLLYSWSDNIHSQPSDG